MSAEAIQESKSGRVFVAMASAAGGAVIWCTVGIGIATLISAFAIFVWAIYVFVVAWPAAALLGSVQGVWLYVKGSRWTRSRERVRFGMVSGSALGLLGFAPAYIQSEILPSHGWWDIAIFVAAALFGGMAAGGVAAAVLPSRTEPQSAPRGARRWIVGGLLILAGVLLEYSLFWPRLTRKLPIIPLDERSVFNLPPGNARGSQWSGCFQYNGEMFWASGIVGSEGGMATIRQDAGALKVSMAGSAASLAGGIDADGGFWAGTQTAVPQGGTLRTLMKGKFQGTDRFEYSLRPSYLKGSTFENTTREDGMGSRCP